ncbi:MAG: BatD family protein [Thermonemataceae bacterium]|nr:BatD family protein [Thermonemataceae bacterium]
MNLLCQISFAQEIRIELVRKKINLNEFMQLRVLSKNEEIRNIDNFPVIKGFEKAFQVNVEFTDRQGNLTKGIEQNYKAEQTGIFPIPSFEMKVNGEKYKFKADEIKVIADENTTDEVTKEQEIIEDLQENEQNIYLNNTEDAFIAVHLPKPQVYVGEEVNLSFAFYLADDAARALDLYQLNQQLAAIIKKIRLPKSWEEDYKLDSVWTEKVTINKRNYKRYKFYQAAFYPSEAGNYVIPSVELVMEDKEEENLINFRSQAVKVQVKPLPESDIKVPTGRFQWQEAITYLKIKTGQTIDYKYTLLGSGNFALLKAPEMVQNTTLEFYKPSTEQSIRKTPYQIIGSKSFKYTILAKKAGKYPLKDFFSFIYFDPEKARYDTLYSRLILEVSGENIEDVSLQSSDLEQELQKASHKLHKIEKEKRTRLFANILLGILFLIVLYQLIRSRMSS